MTPDHLLAAVATAADAHRDARDQLERAIAHARRAGHTGEQINAAVLGGGAPRSGAGGSRWAIEQALQATRDAVTESRTRRTTVTREGDRP